MIEENGHKWNFKFGERCINCQMKYSYYLDIKRASKEQPDRKDLKEWMECKK